jgi:hypothetical protein
MNKRASYFVKKSTSEEKALRDDDELRGLLSSLATQEKPTSRFFFLGWRG